MLESSYLKMNDLSVILNKNIIIRQFPWRKTKDPYKIMIAEFMLHRTKAEQVVLVYEDFINKYPNLDALAKADTEQISKYTEHLGLHWRSNHFINSAKFIIDNFKGIYPSNKEDLLKIPGVGDYVSSVIITVCFNKSVSVIDSNIARFINRFYGLGYTGEIRRKKEIIKKAEILFNNENSAIFLFSLLDFMALICTAKKPRCSECILNDECSYVKENSNKLMLIPNKNF